MISNRKDEHIKYALEEEISNNDFDTVILEHNSLPNLKMDDIDLSTNFLGTKFKLPFYINAMTGGSLKASLINEKLALIAKRYELPIVVGSQSAALKDETLIGTYTIIKDIYPEAFIVANVSANASLDEAKKAINMINANALSIHINVIQELVMLEGDRDFTKWSSNIENIINNIDIPILVKEVGFGMSKKTIDTLTNLNVKYIDVSGQGGTNFARIESKRLKESNNIFNNIGISTVESIKNGKDFKGELYASGGIRNALDIYKALTLGAKAVGLSNFFLKLTDLPLEQAYIEIDNLIEDLKKCYIIFGQL